MKTEQTLKEMQDELEKETIATQKYILQNGKDKVSEILTKYLKNLGQDIQKLTNEIGNKTDNVALYKLHCKNIYCEMNKNNHCIDEAGVYLNDNGKCEFSEAQEEYTCNARKTLISIRKTLNDPNYFDWIEDNRH